MKRKIFALAVLVLALSVIAWGTFAYYTAEKTTHNVITTGSVDIELLEWSDEAKTQPFPADGTESVMPGAEVVKIVEVKNTGSAAAYVRIAAEKTLVPADSAEGEIDPDLIGLDIDETAWTFKDGFYYYSEALEPGETTKPFMTAVTFDASMDNSYKNCSIEIDITAYATQAANNGTGPLEAAGWPDKA